MIRPAQIHKKAMSEHRNDAVAQIYHFSSESEASFIDKIMLKATKRKSWNMKWDTLPIISNLESTYVTGTDRPPICVPKSSFITSSYWSTVLSPELGVQCAATLHIVHNAHQYRPKHHDFFGYRRIITVQRFVGAEKSTYQFREQPVGKAMPASKPFSTMSFRTMSSRVSQMSTIATPGFAYVLMYFRTYNFPIQELTVN